MEVKRGYKTTKIGVIPEDWEIIAVGRAGQVLGGRQRSPHAVGLLCKYLRVANVFDGFIDAGDVLEMPFTAKEKERFFLRDGDILLNEGQSLELVGRSAVYRGVPADCCFQNTLVRFRANPGTDPQFAQAVFQYYLLTGQFAAIASQTTSIAHLGTGRFAALSMPLPPLTEQRAVAGALSDVDTLIGALDQLIAKKRDLKQAAMHQLLTGQTRLSGFQGQWDAPVLGDLFTFKNGLNKAKEFFGYGTPIVNYMDVYGKRGLTARDLKGRVFLTREELKTFEVRKGDVFFTRTSETAEEVGITSVMLDDPRETVFSGFVLRARPKDDSLDDQFKKYCFSSSAVRKQVTSQSTETTRALTNGRYLSAVSIPRPPKPEQTAIAEVLSDMDTEITTLEQRRDKTRALKQGMMQELLTGRTRLI